MSSNSTKKKKTKKHQGHCKSKETLNFKKYTRITVTVISNHVKRSKKLRTKFYNFLNCEIYICNAGFFLQKDFQFLTTRRREKRTIIFKSSEASFDFL